MNDFYDNYRGLGTRLLPSEVDAACDELLRVGEPREAVKILQSFDLLPEPIRSESRRSLAWLLQIIPKPPPADHVRINDADDARDVDDLVWDRPSMKLFRDGDPKPLAKLLLQGVTPPPEVTHLLGRMFLPSEGYLGYRQTVDFDNRKPFWTDAAKHAKLKLKAHRRYKKLMEQEPRPPRKLIIGD